MTGRVLRLNQLCTLEERKREYVSWEGNTWCREDSVSGTRRQV